MNTRERYDADDDDFFKSDGLNFSQQTDRTFINQIDTNINTESVPDL
jgi:hypothetical protein